MVVDTAAVVAVVTPAAVADSTEAADPTAAITGAGDTQPDMVGITAEPGPVHLLCVDRQAAGGAELPVPAARTPDDRGRGKDTVPAIRPQVGISLNLAVAVQPVLAAHP